MRFPGYCRTAVCWLQRAGTARQPDTAAGVGLSEVLDSRSAVGGCGWEVTSVVRV